MISAVIWPGLQSSSGEGNGTPLQYSCLENPMDGGAWWAAVYGVSQSWTRLKRLSCSSNSSSPPLSSVLAIGMILGRFPFNLCASVLSSIKWEWQSTYLVGLL